MILAQKQYSKILRTLILWILILISNSVHAELPDSLQPKLDKFISTLKSDLDNQTVFDSIWSMQQWHWGDIGEDKRKEITDHLNLRIDNSKSLDDKACMHNMLRHIYQYSDQLGKAVVQYEKLIAIHTVQNDTNEVITYYNWMAWMYHNAQLYEQSLISYRALIEYREKMRGDSGMDRYHHYWEFGYLYSVAGWELKKPHYQDSAIKYMRKPYEWNLTFTEDINVEWAITYAMALARDDQKREAISVATKGLKSATNINYQLYMARFNKQLSQYYLALDMKDSAFYHIYQSAKVEDEMNAKDRPDMVKLNNGKGRMNIVNLGFLLNIYEYFGEYDEAISYYDRLLDGPRQIQDYNSLMYYRMLGANAYYQNGEFEKAAHNYRLYLEYTDSVHRSIQDLSRETSTAQLSSQISLEKERAEKEQEELNALAQKEKENLRTIIYSAVSIAILIFVFLAIMYRRFKVAAKQKKLIESQKKMVETAYNELDKKNQEIMDSINYARRIQSAILPPNSIVQEYLPNSFIVYLPKDIVAGDFYWLEHKNDKTLFAAADCTGHGVPCAMVSVVCNNGLNRSVREHNITEPGEILNKTREIVMAEFEKSEEEVNDGMDIALVSLGKVNEDGSRELEYAGAHNPLYIFRNGSNELEELKADKQPIGKFFHQEPYTTHRTTVNSGDMLYVFSDGFSDQFGGTKGKKYYAANFQKFLLRIKDDPLEAQKEKIIEEFKQWKGMGEQIDDVCIIGVRI